MSLRDWLAWSPPAELRRRGILGLNARNLRYLSRVNPRRLHPRADDKLLTKAVARERGIPVPETYAVLERQGDAASLDGRLAGRPEFVLKPARGSEGRGVVVVERHDGRRFETPSGEGLSLDDLRDHVSATLSGTYSLSGLPDRVIVEERLRRHPAFDPLVSGGTPDVRVVVYRGVAVMGMVRLPTRASRGRANLHQGAVAAGIDLATGRTLGGVWFGRPVTAHPDTGTPVAGHEVPGWERALLAALDLAEGLGLGYVGIDTMPDPERGPVVLEANARPGLAIQIANGCGLVPRLERVDAARPESLKGGERLRLSRELSRIG